ncbi:MAG TPA: 5-oxoprolinase subunit PxpA [Thermodesulfobacteriota bacterium]
MTLRIDFNSDMGESFGQFKMGDDEAILDYVSSANLACGWHGGDPLTMRRTVFMAVKKGVNVGAHPSYPDLMGFGRRVMQLTPEEAHNYVVYQLGALAAFCKAAGTTMQHVKPHGALFNAAQDDPVLAEALVAGIKEVDPKLIVVALPGSEVDKAATKIGLKVAREGFADREYTDEGRLVPRTVKGSVIHDPKRIADRVIQMVKGKLVAMSGKPLDVEVHTICLHSDTPGAAELARTIRSAVEAAGIRVTPMRELV